MIWLWIWLAGIVAIPLFFLSMWRFDIWRIKRKHLKDCLAAGRFHATSLRSDLEDAWGQERMNWLTEPPVNYGDVPNWVNMLLFVLIWPIAMPICLLSEAFERMYDWIRDVTWGWSSVFSSKEIYHHAAQQIEAKVKKQSEQPLTRGLSRMSGNEATDRALSIGGE